MESTSTSIADALADFAGGFVSLREIQKILANELRSNPAGAGDVQRLLSDELRSRRLSLADHGELVAGIGALLAGEDLDAEQPSENVPTEAAAETPQEPGIYRFDDEGTLVLAEDMLEADDAYDGVEPPEAAPGIDVGSVLRDRFALREEVARGSMGVVYKAIDLLKQEAGANDPYVAVKLISPEFANRRTALRSFQNEIANAQRLSHPNIVHLHELDRDGDYYFITMEWLEGESLDALLDRSRGSALPPTQTYAIIEQLSDALVYAHEHNVVHADVKPGNVFLVNTGETKLIDFGIAQADDDEASGTVALTPAYASCERLEHQPPTAQDDLFSLACMIYRLLAGRRVFGAMNALEAEKAAVVPVPIGGMSAGRWAALSKALAFRRADRQSTVREFATEFGRGDEANEKPTPRQKVKAASVRGERVESIEDDTEMPFVDTAALNAWPEDELNDGFGDLAGGASTRIEALNETAELHALAGVDKSRSRGSHETTRIDVLNETKQLNSLAGIEVPDLATVRTKAVEQPVRPDSGLSALEESIAADFVRPRSSNAMDVDTARLEVPDDLKIVGDTTVLEKQQSLEGQSLDGQSLEGQSIEEQPFIDTVSLANGTVDIDLLNMGDDEAVNEGIVEREPEPEPEPPPPAPKARAAKKPVPKPKPRKPVEVKPPANPKASEQVRRQLAGQGRAQPSRPALQRVISAVQARPWVSGGAAAALLACVVAAVVFSSGSPVAEPESVTPVAARSEPVRAPAPVTMADDDLIAPPVADSLIAPPVQPADVVADTAAMDQPAAEAAATPAALPTEPKLSQPKVAKPDAANTKAAAPEAEELNAAETKTPESEVAPAPARVDDFAPAVVVPLTTTTSAVPEPRTDLAAPAPVAAALTPDGDAKAAAKYLRMAEEAYIAGDAASARQWAERAEANGAGVDELAPILTLIKRLEKATGDVARPLAPAQGPVPPSAAEVARASNSIGFPEYPLSAFEFVRYVEPRPPTGGVVEDSTGWVDVAFVIGKDGKPRDVHVTGSNLSARFEGPSLAAVRKWRFEPLAPEGGEPIVARTAVRLRFDN